MLGDVGGVELELGALFGGRIGGGSKGVEGIMNVLLGGLVDNGGQWGEDRVDVVGEGEGDLGFGS